MNGYTPDDHTRQLPAVPSPGRNGYDGYYGQHAQMQPRQYPPQYPPAVMPAVMPKSPGIALVVGLFFPGVGNMYAGRMGKGVAILAATFVSWVLCFALIGFVLVPVMHFLVGTITAHNDAQRWNRRHGIVS